MIRHKILIIHGGDKLSERGEIKLRLFERAGYEVTIKKVDGVLDGLKHSVVWIDDLEET